MSLMAEQIPDLVATTLQDTVKDKFEVFATELQNYHVLDYMFKNSKEEPDGSHKIEREVMVDTLNQAKMVGQLENDSVNDGDVMELIHTNWKHTTTNFLVNHQTDILMNQNSPNRIVSMLKKKRTASLIDIIELCESQFWGAPSGTADRKTINGVKYWVVQSASEGFNGGSPSGFTDVGGLSPTTYSNWKNYTFTYGTVAKTDLIPTMRKAYKKINFKAPMMIDTAGYGKSMSHPYRIYMDVDTHDAFEEVAEAQNENLGKDVASLQGVTFFRNCPVVWVAQLDSETNSPIFMLNHNKIHVVCLRGDQLRETVRPSPWAHNVTETHIDLTWNVFCTDRRSQAVGYQV